MQFVAQQLAARLFATMVQEHERAAGAWRAEWIVLPQLCNLAHSALRAIVQLMDGLQVNVARMQENLTLTAGLIFAAPFANLLAPQLGRERAHSLVAVLCRRAVDERRPLRDVVERDLPQTGARATPGELAAMFSAHRDVAAAAPRTRYYLEHRNRTDG